MRVINCYHPVCVPLCVSVCVHVSDIAFPQIRQILHCWRAIAFSGHRHWNAHLALRLVFEWSVGQRLHNGLGANVCFFSTM